MKIEDWTYYISIVMATYTYKRGKVMNSTMFKYVIVITISILLISCSSQHKVYKNLCRGILQNDIAENWKYNVDSLYYKSNGAFLYRIDTDYRRCLTNITSEQIIKLFGSPSKKRIRSYEYFLNPESTIELTSLLIFLNDSGIVRNYLIITKGKPSIIQ